ncbi:hypothetical protein BC828DRAFT_415066 [Blastocladiella britannica]|nr:hypothetical protein BC828DRAFT_415066 [Blastocladiella britannica]
MAGPTSPTAPAAVAMPTLVSPPPPQQMSVQDPPHYESGMFQSMDRKAAVGPGWFETRQAMAQEEREAEIFDKRVMAGLTLQGAMLVYFVVTLIVLAFEGTFAVLFLTQSLPNPLDMLINDTSISEDERNFYIMLQAKQHTYLIIQSVWFGISLIACLAGLAIVWTQHLGAFKFLRIWIVKHMIVYAAGAVIFGQVNPLAFVVPGYVLVTIMVALFNLYAVFLSATFKKQLVALAKRDAHFANLKPVGEIGGPML